MAKSTAQQKLEDLKAQQRAVREELKAEAAEEAAKVREARGKIFNRLADIDPEASLDSCLGVLAKCGIKTWGQLYTTVKTPGARLKGHVPKPKVTVSEEAHAAVLTFCLANPGATSADISKATGCSGAIPSAMAAGGFLAQSGRGRGTRYSATA
jgi:hypothetical protein